MTEQLSTKSGIDSHLLRKWENLDFSDEKNVMQLRRLGFGKADLWAHKEDDGSLMNPRNIDGFLSFLKGVNQIEDKNDRRKVMSDFLGLREKLKANRELTRTDLALAHQYHLSNLAGAKIVNLKVDHALNADFGENGFIENVETPEFMASRVGKVKGLSVNNSGDGLVWIKNASGDVEINDADQVRIFWAKGDVKINHPHKYMDCGHGAGGVDVMVRKARRVEVSGQAHKVEIGEADEVKIENAHSV